jgi:hypothetical protein
VSVYILYDCSDKKIPVVYITITRMNVVVYIIITRMNVVDNLNSV